MSDILKTFGVLYRLHHWVRRTSSPQFMPQYPAMIAVCAKCHGILSHDDNPNTIEWCKGR